jgi:hypothetical protein
MIDAINREFWPRHYILNGRMPMAVDHETGTRWAAQNRDSCRVALTKIADKCEVSTAFLGVDLSFECEGPPLVFESLVFGGPTDMVMRRYSTWDEAERGHAKLVDETRKACARIGANPARINNGLEPIVPAPDAYEPCEEGDLGWN